MSLEAALAENTAASLALVEMLKEISQNQKGLLAASTTAIEKVSETKPAATRTRKKAEPETVVEEKKAEPETVVEEKKAEPETVVEEKKAEPVAEKPAAPKLPTADELKAKAIDWINEHPKGTDARKERGDFVLSVQDHIGTKLGELTDEDEIKQAAFFLNRKIAGHDVNFSHEYDFDAAVDQDAPAADDGDDSDFG